MNAARISMLALGTALCIAGIALATSFFYVSSHSWYWLSNPLMLCIFILISTAAGSFLVGFNIKRGRRDGWFHLGILLLVAWAVCGIISFAYGLTSRTWMWILARMIESSDWPFNILNFGDYKAEYFADGSPIHGFSEGGYHIYFLLVAAVAGLLGGFLAGNRWGKRGEQFYIDGGV